MRGRVNECLQGRLALPYRDSPEARRGEFRVKGIRYQPRGASELSHDTKRRDEQQGDAPTPLEGQEREQYYVLAAWIGLLAGAPRSCGHG